MEKAVLGSGKTRLPIASSRLALLGHIRGTGRAGILSPGTSAFPSCFFSVFPQKLWVTMLGTVSLSIQPLLSCWKRHLQVTSVKFPQGQTLAKALRLEIDSSGFSPGLPVPHTLTAPLPILPLPPDPCQWILNLRTSYAP